MKKNFNLLNIVILTMLLAIAGCKKDPEKPLIDLLIGKWEMQSAYYEYYENGVKTGELYDSFGQNDLVYEFLKNGAGKLYEKGTLKNSFTWTLDGTIATIEKPNEVITGELSIENGILTISGSNTYSSNGINYADFKTLSLKNI